MTDQYFSSSSWRGKTINDQNPEHLIELHIVDADAEPSVLGSHTGELFWTRHRSWQTPSGPDLCVSFGYFLFTSFCVEKVRNDLKNLGTSSVNVVRAKMVCRFLRDAVFHSEMFPNIHEHLCSEQTHKGEKKGEFAPLYPLYTNSFDHQPTVNHLCVLHF